MLLVCLNDNSKLKDSKDTNNHIVRKILYIDGTITTIAGTRTSGYNGDGILATSATLNQPSGIAFDSKGNMYIAGK